MSSSKLEPLEGKMTPELRWQLAAWAVPLAALFSLAAFVKFLVVSDAVLWALRQAGLGVQAFAS